MLEIWTQINFLLKNPVRPWSRSIVQKNESFFHTIQKKCSWSRSNRTKSAKIVSKQPFSNSFQNQIEDCYSKANETVKSWIKSCANAKICKKQLSVSIKMLENPCPSQCQSQKIKLCTLKPYQYSSVNSTKFQNLPETLKTNPKLKKSSQRTGFVPINSHSWQIFNPDKSQKSQSLEHSFGNCKWHTIKAYETSGKPYKLKIFWKSTARNLGKCTIWPCTIRVCSLKIASLKISDCSACHCLTLSWIRTDFNEWQKMLNFVNSHSKKVV